MNFFQFLWQRILRFLQRLLGAPALPGGQSGGTASFPLDIELARELQDLAHQQRRSQDELAAELLSYALAQRDALELKLQRWNRLSEREQQVAALVCLGCTNRQVAARLHLSPETVKTHVRNALYKFDLHSRNELRQLLSDWDFSAWADPS